MTAYYNEHDPKAAAWLRELIKAGLIAPGIVDERSIVDVNPYELTQYTQHHFFAGIGGWSYALRLAGWPDSKRIVTGSCPCQPFSAAGQQLGTKDERHLWPAFYNCITFLDVPDVVGEQVASPLALSWLDTVFADLEGAGYACGAADLCAAGVGADHIRQRLYWMGHANRSGSFSRRQTTKADRYRSSAFANGGSRGLADTDSRQRNGLAGGKGRKSYGTPAGWEQGNGKPQRSGTASRLADSDGGQRGNGDVQRSGQHGQQPQDGRADTFWGIYEIVNCTDGKARRFEPGSFPLAHGVSSRVGLLRGYGNAIVPQVAAEFIKAAIESITQ